MKIIHTLLLCLSVLFFIAADLINIIPYCSCVPLQISSSNHTVSKPLVLRLKTQLISPPTKNKQLPFTHNVTLTVSLAVGSPPQNVTMVLDTGSELSWLQCNATNNNTRPTFVPARSISYSPVPCSSATCTDRTQDFTIPASCDANSLCHAILSYADASSSEGNLATDTFSIAGSNFPNTVFGCMNSGYSSNMEEDSKTTGLIGMNRGSLSFISQMGFKKFSYCISGEDFSGILLFGDSNMTWLLPLNYTPLIQMSIPLPYFDRVAYTVQLEGIMVRDKLLHLPKSIFEPDHTGAGQTMVDSGTQFTFLLGPAYTALRNEFVNQTASLLRALDEGELVFQGAFDLCFNVPPNFDRSKLPSVSLALNGAQITVSGGQLLVPGGFQGHDSVHCFTFGNSDLAGVESYIIGHHHQQNVWMEFDLEKSRIGVAKVRCDQAGQRFGLYHH